MNEDLNSRIQFCLVNIDTLQTSINKIRRDLRFLEADEKVAISKLKDILAKEGLTEFMKIDLTAMKKSFKNIK